jgi:tetratricopeptide (TPR) repeat protein
VIKRTLAHSNQLHQLLVSVSRHLYVKKNSLLKYQEKPLDINLSTLQKSRREHLVYYLLRDALAGTFFLEITTSRTMFPLAEFLYRAWEQTPGKYIWGLPESLSLPKRLAVQGLLGGLHALDVKAVLPSSGFAAGVRAISVVEENLLYFMGRTVDHRPHVLNLSWKEDLYRYVLGLRRDEPENKYEQWQAAWPEQGTRAIPDRESFLSDFYDREEPISGVLWVKKEQESHPEPAVWEKETWPPFDEKLYNRADHMLAETDDLNDRDMLIEQAWETLNVSPYSVDAFNLLAGESRILNEKIYFYQQGIRAGRMILGEPCIQGEPGHLWENIDTRPYMEAHKGYADSLREAERRELAIEAYEELLRLDPADYQGARYDLSACLLEDGRDDTMRLLMARYGDEKSCFISYDKALWTFRVTGGANERSNQMLAEALVANEHVPAFLLRERPIPFRPPSYYGFGDENEAAIYASNSRKAWEQTPGALEWLQEMRSAAGREK